MTSMPNDLVGHLTVFLRKAYVHAWPKNVSIIPDGSDFEHYERVRYNDGLWEYKDTYFGAVNDAGIEVVRRNRQPVWSNVYRGGLLVSGSANEIFAFLTEALDAPADGGFQIRGPQEYTSPTSDMSYRFKSVGDIARFAGVEIILKGTLPVYERVLAGGLIGGTAVDYARGMQDLVSLGQFLLSFSDVRSDS